MKCFICTLHFHCVFDIEINSIWLIFHFCQRMMHILTIGLLSNLISQTFATSYQDFSASSIHSNTLCFSCIIIKCHFISNFIYSFRWLEQIRLKSRQSLIGRLIYLSKPLLPPLQSKNWRKTVLLMTQSTK